MDIIYALSFALSQMIKVNEAQAIGLFSLAIKDANKKPGELSYDDCRGVIQVQLKARLEKMKFGNLEKITADMLKLLVQKQSLFVMSGR